MSLRPNSPVSDKSVGVAYCLVARRVYMAESNALFDDLATWQRYLRAEYKNVASAF